VFMMFMAIACRIKRVLRIIVLTLIPSCPEFNELLELHNQRTFKTPLDESILSTVKRGANSDNTRPSFSILANMDKAFKLLGSASRNAHPYPKPSTSSRSLALGTEAVHFNY
jgi:hypothetical protein